MKNKLYTILYLFTALLSAPVLSAQTLGPGDIAIIEYQSDAAAETFAFVCLTDIPGGEIIFFSDNEYNGVSLTSGEGVLEWTTPAAGVPCGTVVNFVNNFNVGTFSQGLGSFDLQAGNAQDEIIVYQNATNNIFAQPTTYIYAHTYTLGAWIAGINEVPPGLTDGLTAHAIPHIDNGAYNGTTTGSQNALLTSIANTANWNTNNNLGPAYVGANPMTVTSCVVGCLHTVTSLAPASGPVGTIVTIGGTGFSAASTVDFSGAAAGTVIFVNSTTLVVLVPVGAVTGPVTVNEGGCPAAGPVFTLIDQSGVCVTPPVINAQPTDVNKCPFLMNLVASSGGGGALTYQWKFNDGFAAGWTDVNAANLPTVIVAGETTDNLSFSGDLTSINGYQFYCEVTESGCMVASEAAQFNYDDRFFRSAANGNWGNVVKWESATVAAGPWTPACACPNATNSDYIHVLPGHSVNVNQSISVDQLVIESGATLNINTNRLLTFGNAAGVDLDVQGTLIDNGTAGNGANFSGSGASWILGVNGEIVKTRNSSVNEYRDNYEGGISTIPETANWRYRFTGTGVVAVSTTNMFYPNLYFESSDPLGHDFSAVSEAFSGTTGGFATVKGSFFVGNTEAGHVSVYNTNSNVSPMLVLGNMVIGGNASANRSFFVNSLGGTIGTGIHVMGNLTINSNGGLNFNDGVGGTSDGTIQLSGNWNNLATEVDFGEGESTVSFEGAGTQTISISSGFERFYNLNVNKTGNTLNPLSDVHIENNGNFSTGIVNNNFGASFFFAINATATGASNVSHVDGPVQKETTNAFAQNFTFPTGDNNRLGPIGIETRPGSLDDDVFTAEYFALPSPNPTQIAAPIDHVSGIEHWRLVEGDGNNDSPAKVMLAWGIHSNVIAVADIRVGHYKSSNLWEMEGDVPNIVHTGTISAGTVTSDWVMTFSPFTLADINSTGSLPLDLLSFEAHKIDFTTKLDWVIANEKAGDEYAIERSIDGASFERIYTTIATQNQSTTDYSFLDENPVLGDNYYRLKQTDNNGLISYGPLRIVNFEQLSTEAFIFPNPARNAVTIELPGIINEEVTVEIIDVLGQVLLQELVQKGNHTLLLNVSQLPAGQYIMRWGSQTRKSVSQKFTIKG